MIDKIKSLNFAIYAAIVAVLIQTPHTTHILGSFSKMVEPWNFVHGFIAALVLDALVMFFVLKGNRFAGIFFGFCILAVNFAYYQVSTAEPISYLMSSLFPIAIFLVTEEVNKTRPPRKPRVNVSEPKVIEVVDKKIQIINLKGKLPQAEIARQIGCSKSYVSKVLNS